MIIVVSIIGMIASGVCVYNQLKKKLHQADMMDKIDKYVDDEKTDATVQSNEELKNIDWKNLKSINSDIVGWIQIPNTEINYPVVYGSDNEFYLKHSYDKSLLHYGSIFMDHNTNFENGALNTFIYGHNVYGEDSMFSSLKYYKDINYYSQHKYFYYYTEEHIYKCYIFSFYTDEGDSDSFTYDAVNKNKLNEYIELVKSKNIYQTDIVDPINLIITLYTCSHDKTIRNPSERYYLHASVEELQ